MKKQINESWKALLLVTVAILMMLGASGAVFAQKADKYPKPDFRKWKSISRSSSMNTNLPDSARLR